jgi:hypothetical protein
MSLDISKLENVRKRGGKVIARCPACAEAGYDQKGEHLVINARGPFGCVVYPGDSADAKEHRKRIFALCGDREIKPLAVHPSGLGRLGRVFQTHLAVRPVKTGLLGCLGRVFETHLEQEREPSRDKEHNAYRQLNDCGKGVPSVPVEPHRPLSEREWTILVRAGAENDPIIIEALRLFDARIVE